MKKILPIWFNRHSQGILIEHEAGIVIGKDPWMMSYITGIRIYDDKWKGKNWNQIIEGYYPGLWFTQ